MAKKKKVKKKASPVKSTVEKKPAGAVAPRRKESKPEAAVAVAEAPKSNKAEKGKKALKGALPPGGITNTANGEKLTRLGLIKQRHEAMRREIDQIREDLESDEEE
ncbi:MAG TPA: hypothetical protein VEJ63_05970 [Planctomycetota bacterium]|nr:hypothetical protein [Planctomycetota bacterium]